MKYPKDYRPLVKAARKAGWRLITGRGKHHRLVSPDGAVVILAGSPAARKRSLKNTRAELRRHGVDC